MKHLIKFLLIFCFAELSAQKEQNFILSTHVGYNYTFEDKSDNFTFDFLVPGERKIQELNLSMSVGRKFRTNFYYGLGFAINWWKDEWNPNLNEPYPAGQTGMASSSFVSNYVYSPLAYLQYFANLGGRAQLTFSLISRYDFEKTTAGYKIFQPSPLNGDDDFTIRTSERETTWEFFYTGLVPGFRLNLYKSFGMNVAFGDVAYRIKTADSRLPDMDIKKSREFNVNFRPENWRMGFYLAF